VARTDGPQPILPSGRGGPKPRLQDVIPTSGFYPRLVSAGVHGAEVFIEGPDPEVNEGGAAL